MTKAADAVSLAKWILRNEAEELGLKVTFMPKPMYGVAGSGMHVHQFIVKDGVSIFPGEALYGLSEKGLAYTAGLLSHALTGSLLAFSNPSTNSYRRLVPGYELRSARPSHRGRGLRRCVFPGISARGKRASSSARATPRQMCIIFLRRCCSPGSTG